MFAEGHVAHRWQIGHSYDPAGVEWAASVALAARFGHDNWAVTPWIAIPVAGDPADWTWWSAGCSLDFAR